MHVPYNEVFHSLMEQKLIVLELPPQVPNSPPKWLNPNETYIYHIEALKHSIEKVHLI